MRIGIGYDMHRLVEGRPMMLGGVELPHVKGPSGHSDGDALLHAVCDALLGALGKGDIGRMFPDTDGQYKDISSRLLLQKVFDSVKQKGYVISNLDCVVILEEPRIGPYHEKMSSVIAGVLEMSPKDVSIKGKTAEKLGAVGRGEAVAAYAVVLLTESR
jgi:2-C-methyl-D-erythritol 2,4-cyclodiphosphate synthase